MTATLGHLVISQSSMQLPGIGSRLGTAAARSLKRAASSKACPPIMNSLRQLAEISSKASTAMRQEVVISQQLNYQQAHVVRTMNSCNHPHHPSSESSAFSSSNPFFQSAVSACSRVKPISISRLAFDSLISGDANFFTHSAACQLYLLRFSLYSEATTASWGSLGSGTQSSACRESRAVRMVNAGDHSSLRMSRQMAPVWEEMLGCQILVQNFIFGGLQGYSGGRMMSIWKKPPLYGVSSGPWMYPFQCRKSPLKRLTRTVDFYDQIRWDVQFQRTIQTPSQSSARFSAYILLLQNNQKPEL